VLVTTTIALAAGTMLLLAVFVGWALGVADRKLYVAVDPKITAVNAALPGANCGGCGYVGCGDYAEAVVTKGAAVNLCGPGGPSCSQAIAGILGVAVDQSWPKRPIVHCTAERKDRLQSVEYRYGDKTCQAANLVNGVQGCVYGCLGFGDCVAACDYDAIEVKNGLARVVYDKCIGCGACAKACPRNIISMVPFKSSRILAVLCSSKDVGKEVRDVCNVGCVACKLCEKGSALFKLVNNVPTIDYDRYDPKASKAELDKVVEKCPREALVWVGKPSPEDLAATKDDKLPTRVEAQFETTVDKTDWRG